tara:strand:- start:370 stop:843 length:474 start_codon:yes stop_codon:yes gene_type:complete
MPNYQHSDYCKNSDDDLSTKDENISYFYDNSLTKNTSFLGKVMSKFKKYTHKIFTAEEIKENDEFKQTKTYSEGNDFTFMSKKIKNKKTGETITNTFKVNGYNKKMINHNHNHNYNHNNNNNKMYHHTHKKIRKICKYYHKNGYCKYGSKCKFRHAD